MHSGSPVGVTWIILTECLSKRAAIHLRIIHSLSHHFRRFRFSALLAKGKEMRFFRIFLLIGYFCLFAFQANHFHPAHAVSTVPSAQLGVRSTITQVFGTYAGEALQVAQCESGLNPDAANPSGATGLFQIMPATWNGTSFQPYTWAKATNAGLNTQVAFSLFSKDGYQWRQWGCKPSHLSG